jgi:hypothetical protein
MGLLRQRGRRRVWLAVGARRGQGGERGKRQSTGSMAAAKRTLCGARSPCISTSLRAEDALVW